MAAGVLGEAACTWPFSAESSAQCGLHGAWGPGESIPVSDRHHSSRRSTGIPAQPCLCLPSLRDGAKRCSSRGLRINELTFEDCWGDELEVLSTTISRGSLKITSLKRSDK